MTSDESADGALFRGPLPEGFSRRMFRVAPGLELDLEASRLPDPILVVEQERPSSSASRGRAGASGAAR
jgi:hypothetical protein